MDFKKNNVILTLPETNSEFAPGTKPAQKERNLVFQASIFWCYVSFREDIWYTWNPKASQLLTDGSGDFQPFFM